MTKPPCNEFCPFNACDDCDYRPEIEGQMILEDA